MICNGFCLRGLCTRCGGRLGAGGIRWIVSDGFWSGFGPLRGSSLTALFFSIRGTVIGCALLVECPGCRARCGPCRSLFVALFFGIWPIGLSSSSVPRGSIGSLSPIQ